MPSCSSCARLRPATAPCSCATGPRSRAAWPRRGPDGEVGGQGRLRTRSQGRATKPAPATTRESWPRSRRSASTISGSGGSCRACCGCPCPWGDSIRTCYMSRFTHGGGMPGIGRFRFGRPMSLLICARPQRQVVGGGGAWAWLVVRVGCARTPSLISVRDPGWLWIGDMMVDGVIRDAVRPLCL